MSMVDVFVLCEKVTNDELLSFDYTDDPADIEICQRHRDLAMARTVPYAEFMRGVSLA